jgi:NAD(P)-dependent dehydrogenase (short-subunit alcohol dehydrogenase family)
MVSSVLEDFGGQVQILVNDAGITRDRSFVKMSRQQWDEVIAVNLGGPFNVCHAVLPSMMESGWGRIINISSIVGQ